MPTHKTNTPRVQESLHTNKLLSVSEREIISWLREGKTNWEIGRILGKSENTVKNQIAKMLNKSGAMNRHELAKLP